MKYFLVIFTLAVSSFLAHGDSGSELIKNSDFWTQPGKSRPQYWSIVTTTFGKKGVTFPVKSAKKKTAICEIDTSKTGSVVLSQSIDLKKNIGQKVSLKGRLYFEKFPRKKPHEIYLRIRQLDNKGPHKDLAKMWVRVFPDKIMIQRWQNGRHEPPVTIKAQKRKWIDIESYGIVAENMKLYQLFITAGPVGNKPVSDSMRFKLSDISAKKVVPPVLELSPISKIYTTDSKLISFTAKVNPRKNKKQANKQSNYKLKVAIERYDGDMLMYRAEKEYNVSRAARPFAFPTKNLSPGIYVLMFDLITEEGHNLASEVMEVEIINGPFSD